MQSSSRRVTSSQHGVHPGLPGLIQRHRQHPWQKPAQDVDLPALDLLDKALNEHQGPLILDSFCGTGHSTARLARQHNDALVVGIDQSKDRLSRRPEQPNNCLLLRAHCEAVWRHLVAKKRSLTGHYLLYPNPWPKPGHLSRRVHGHPSFPLVLALGGTLELRSNWQLYVEEFGVALQLFGHTSCVAIVPDDQEPLTLFEHKYRESGHDLWSITAQLTPSTPDEDLPPIRYP